ncbi:ribonucleotide reductase subunit alpha [Caenimonas sedimenti]|uniref:Ribonucleotide reductase subunit alpha n=1 Tax=Caenimonas sedimenti TaxID=2596921 RepID=A0A562ZWQ6_9BURK|nr:ribonucleotide reductase subunit alpha [Caenimonas sedimenti]TWO72725.1 ribonucleotide reductase subunit alpha [Caenimonas sedimenti]
MTSTSPHFHELLQSAAGQPEPQRLLFVFAGAGLPEDATPAQRARFEAGEGGTLEPLACVDKRPDELTDFEALAAEARQACPPWHVVFIAALGGQAGAGPTDGQVDDALRGMVENLRVGRMQGYSALDPAGEPVAFE